MTAIEENCLDCTSDCHDCHDDNRCRVCNSSFYLLPTHPRTGDAALTDYTTCTSACGDGYFQKDDTNLTFENPNMCIPCADPNCQDCTGATFEASSCIACSGAYNVQGEGEDNNVCQLVCDTGFFADGGICKPCGTSCDECTSNTICTLCTSGTYLHVNQDGSGNNDCMAVCPDEFFEENVDNTLLSGAIRSEPVCTACSSDCLLCQSLAFCDTCKDNFFRLAAPRTGTETGATCTSDCGDTYFGNVPAKTCDVCTDANCKTCSSVAFEASSCEVCSGAYNVQGEGEDNNVCQLVCDTGFFADGGICKPCGTSCDECTSNTICTLCTSGTYLHVNQDGSGNNDCMAVCPDEFFEENVDNTLLNGVIRSEPVCTACTAGCATCQGLAVCDTCKDGFFRLSAPRYGTEIGATCVATTCGDTYFSNDTDNTCDICLDANCLKCPTSTDTCEECNATYFNHSIQSIDPEVTQPTTDPLGNASSGNFPAVLQTVCLASCPSFGTYPLPAPTSGDVDTCAACEALCQHCTGPETCQTCVTPNFRYNDSCFASCDDTANPPDSTTTYPVTARDEDDFDVIIDRICAVCEVSECETCDESNSKCDTCTSGFVMFANTCTPECPFRTYRDGDNCINCSDECDVCDDGSTCTQCAGSYILHEGACIQDCPEGTLLNLTNRTCDTDCQVADCTTCLSVNKCRECDEGFRLTGTMTCTDSNPTPDCTSE